MFLPIHTGRLKAMRVSVILGHPCRASFNHAIAETVVRTLRAAGHMIWYHDLYGEGFDPVTMCAEIPKGAPLDPVIQRHCDEIAAADGIVIVHPNWWGQPPAILKGWADRVIRVGVAYAFEEGTPLPGAVVLVAPEAKAFPLDEVPLAMVHRTDGLVGHRLDRVPFPGDQRAQDFPF